MEKPEPGFPSAMHAWGHSPSGSTIEPPPDAPQGPADGRDIPRREWCPLASGVSSAFLSAEPAPSSLRSRSPAPATGLRTFLAAAPHLCPPPPPAAASRAGCLERIRALAFHRRVVPGAFPDGETARIPRQPVTARVPCKTPSISPVNSVFFRSCFMTHILLKRNSLDLRSHLCQRLTSYIPVTRGKKKVPVGCQNGEIKISTGAGWCAVLAGKWGFSKVKRAADPGAGSSALEIRLSPRGPAHSLLG